MNDESEPLKEPPLAGTELDTLVGSLERVRRTFAWKCADLDAAQMAVTIGKSAITIGGLLRHLARAEDDLFGWKLHDEERATGTESDGWERDWQWTAADDPAEALEAWHATVSRSRQRLAAAVADGGLGRTKGHEFVGWGTPSVRRLMVDMIEEYARHTGHTDLIREAIDGRVGEDPPE